MLRHELARVWKGTRVERDDCRLVAGVNGPACAISTTREAEDGARESWGR